ncbi:NHL repeat protein [Legionella cincinnatiensis]|uniref:NHL repeat protein n=2 Tax=Legionella cincinnatiensis TaxID=28085 RepID=A0A378IL63_9GAMM|nr:NHL repeat protein [Legionella cincinnatiensis]STX35522.1 NHL repeat protein [Legionella cincinnatiensis]
MKKCYFMNKIFGGLLTFFSISMAMASTASPLWTFVPLTDTTLTIIGNSKQTVKYTVTNQSKRTHSLVMTPIPGISQITSPGYCPNVFTLGYKQSCILGLYVDGSELKSNIVSGPQVCQRGNGLQCYQPSEENSLNIKNIQSLCDTNLCTEKLSIFSGEQSTFDNYFTIVNGYHVGTQEYQEYLPKNITFIPKNTESPAFIKLSAIPSADFPCIGRGYVDPNNRAIVSTGTCTYTSGAFYSYRKGFYVNKDSQGKTINHGGIEIRLRIEKEDPNLTMDQLYQKGAWPAVWMMSPYIDDTFRFNSETFIPKNLWPSAMEIDILELINGGWTATTPIIGSIHYGYLANETATSWNYINNIGDYDRQILPLYPVADSSNWHNYGFTWERKDGVSLTSYVLSWYYDGIKYTSLTITRKKSETTGNMIFSAEREVNGEQQLIWCTSSSPRCCTVESNRCNLVLNVPMPLTEAEVMFDSLTHGFDNGYYLNVNLAAGGEGIGVYDPSIPGFPPPSFGRANMQISHINRFVIK